LWLEIVSNFRHALIQHPATDTYLAAVFVEIGLALVKVGIQYAAGGVPAKMSGAAEYGSLLNWSAALVVIVVTLGLKFFTRGMLAISAVLVGLLVGYLYALSVGMLTLQGIADNWRFAKSFALPELFKYEIGRAHV